MGKKYIIELEEEPFIKHFKNGAWETIYRVKGFNSLVFDWNGLQMLTPYTELDLEQVRKEAYEQGINDANYAIADDSYKKGLSDAWDAARKIICEMDDEDIMRIFGGDNFDYIFALSPTTAIEKLKDYEQEQNVQVGDEVTTASGKAVVTGVGPVHFEYVYADGSHGYDEVKNVKNTGRHFPEIAEVLKKMRG